MILLKCFITEYGERDARFTLVRASVANNCTAELLECVHSHDKSLNMNTSSVAFARFKGD